MDIWTDIKNTFKNGGILIQLIIINIAVFFAVNIIDILITLFSGQAFGMGFSITDWLAVPSSLQALLFKPWTLLTYMFLHQGLMHLLFNMLWLYWFGKLFIYFIGEKQMLTVYIYGGLAGAALFILLFNIVPLFTPFIGVPMLGASAAVMAIVLAVSVYQPDYEINLMFIGPVKLKYIALISVGLDMIQAFGSNGGGHIAHLGGALLGYYFIKDYRTGKDWSVSFNKFTKKIERFIKGEKELKVVYRKKDIPRDDMDYNKMKKDNEAKLNGILDKISKKGYSSLTKSEKEFLFKQGKN